MSRTIHMSHVVESDYQPPEGVGIVVHGVTVWASDNAKAEALAVGMNDAEAEAWSCLDDLISAFEFLGQHGPSYYEGRTIFVPPAVEPALNDLRRFLLARPTARLLETLQVEPTATGVR